MSWGDTRNGNGPGTIRGTAGKILERGHSLSDERMSSIVAAIEEGTGKPMTLSEIAYALSISKTRAITIRNITPKAKQNGNARYR